MDLIEANQQIQRMEANHDLFAFQVDGYSGWCLLRFRLAILASKLVVESNPVVLNKRRSFQITFRDLFSLLGYHSPNLIAFTASTNRAEIENGLYKDIYFDDLLKNIRHPYKVEHINNPLYLPRSMHALIPSNITTTGINLVTSLLMRKRRSNTYLTAAEPIHATIEQYFPGVLSAAMIVRIFEHFHWNRRVYTALLSYLKPEMIVMQTAYTRHALVAAAQERDIKVIEFQHGIIDRHHPGYSWLQSAQPYKAQIPLPDRIYLYGEHWKNELTYNHFWDRELRIVGSARLDQYRKKRRDDIESKSLKILVTTQGIDVDPVNSFLLKFLEIAENHKKIQLWIKLHPRESKKTTYEEAFKGHTNVQIIMGQEDPSTFELLCKADFHASIHSTCHYEALGLGTPTIILPFSGHERVLHLVTGGYGILVSTPEEMAQLVCRVSVQRVPERISEYFFKPDALENTITALKAEGLENIQEI
jgi:hypothetical protein